MFTSLLEYLKSKMTSTGTTVKATAPVELPKLVSPAEVKLSPEWWAAQVKVSMQYIGGGHCDLGDRIPGLSEQVFTHGDCIEVTVEQAQELLAITQPRGGCCGRPAFLFHLFEVA